MLTIEDILHYHLDSNPKPASERLGFELELFCVNPHTKELLFYNQRNTVTLANMFDYLKEYHGFTSLDASKTLGVERNGYKITLEPGAQVEFASAPNEDMGRLVNEYREFIEILQILARKFDVYWLDVSFFPGKTSYSSPLIPSARYAIMDSYLRQAGELGWAFLRYTCALHINVDFKDRADLEQKVTRILFAKPVLSFLAANSQVKDGCRTGYRSYREQIYMGIDKKRTGDPGAVGIWQRGYWTLADYIQKVINAPTMFDVEARMNRALSYKESDHKPFAAYMDRADIESYLVHNSTMYTDVRIRNYIEIRFMDNPGIALVPSIALLVYKLVYDQDFWKKFQQLLPYRFDEVPHITELLNHMSDASDDYWQTYLRDPLLSLVRDWQKDVSFPFTAFIQRLIEKMGAYPSLAAPDDIPGCHQLFLQELLAFE